MIDFKEIIAKEIIKQVNMDIEVVKGFIEVPSNKEMGDYSFPCFKLAKEFKKAPQMIATELKENLQFNETEIKSVEVVNGYLNFFTNPVAIAKSVLEEINEEKENYGSSTIGNGKNIVVDYSSFLFPSKILIEVFPSFKAVITPESLTSIISSL